MYSLILIINTFRGELTDIPADTKSFVTVSSAISSNVSASHPAISVAVLAEIPRRSPQKLFIFIIKKFICWLKVSKNKIIYFWKKLHYLLYVCFDHRTVAGRAIWAVPTVLEYVETATKFAYHQHRLSHAVSTLQLTHGKVTRKNNHLIL